MSGGNDELGRLARSYEQNAAVIDRNRVPTLDFDTGLSTGRLYSRAKVIDMVFFVEGLTKATNTGR